MAAGSLIITEAGGLIGNFTGEATSCTSAKWSPAIPRSMGSWCRSWRHGLAGDLALHHVQAGAQVRVFGRARCQPLPASASAWPMVALFSAKVDVRATAPGMLATQ
jgi:hypothetical protein